MPAPMRDGGGEYLPCWTTALACLDMAHPDGPPGLILYLAGAAAHEGDRLGCLKLAAAGLSERDRRVLDSAWRRRIPLAFSMAGTVAV